LNEQILISAVQDDDDWYQIYVSSGYEQVLVDCQFTYADGDIDLQLTDDQGSVICQSTTTSNDEYIDCCVPSSGTYYIRVFGDDTCTDYDLWWDDVVCSPSCFQPVDPTGKPYTVIVMWACMEDVEIPVNTEIGVFDGNLCVGSGTFDGSWPVTITAWEKDAGNSLPGFTPGNPILFRYCISGTEYSPATIDALDEGNGNFGTSPYTAAYICYHSEICVEIDGGRWDWISLWEVPADGDIVNMCGDLQCLRQIIDHDGLTYIPGLVNTIGTYDCTKGYAVYSTCDDTLCVATTGQQCGNTIYVDRGRWNLIPYSLNQCTPTATAMGSMGSEIKQLLAVDGRTWIPDIPVMTLTELCPGEGYRVFLKPGSPDPYPFTYQVTIPLASSRQPGVVAKPVSSTGAFIYNPVAPTGKPYTVIVVLSEAFRAVVGSPSSGDEIGIFDLGQNPGLCVGASQNFAPDTTVTVTCWEQDLGNSLPGFAPGNPITVKFYNSDEGIEYACSGSLVEGDGTFGYSPYTLFVLQGGVDTDNHGALNGLRYDLSQNRPNPFNPQTTIEYTLEKRAHVAVSIYNILGEHVRTLIDDVMPAGIHMAVWNGKDTQGLDVATGVYFYHLKTEGFVQTKKMLLLR